MFLGSFLRYKLEKTVLERGIFIVRLIHKFIGRVIYIGRKVIITYYFLKYLEQLKVGTPEIVVVALYVTILLFHVTMIILNREKSYNQDAEKLNYHYDKPGNELQNELIQ